jgi:hypothetical protein
LGHHGLFQGNIVLVLADGAFHLLSVVVDLLETVLSIQLGVLGQLLLETRIVLLLIEQSGELAKFRNQVQLLDLLVVLGSKFALVDQQGLFGVGNVERVGFLIILNEGLRFVVDLNVVHGTLGEIYVGDFVNAKVAVVSDHWLTNDLLLDLTFFPSFLL